MKPRSLFAALFAAAFAFFVAAGLFAPGASPTASAQTAELPALKLDAPLGGFSFPVGIANAGDGSNRLFVVEQGGRIRVVKNGALVSTPFLDISGRISAGGERGLLGLAFPPEYARKGYFYVNYTNTAGNTVISRFQRSTADPDAADPSSEQVIITIAQPFANHNGGQLAFGRDRMLYVGMGDGGDGGDPGNRAQNTAELLGKLLRLDVETGRPYTYTVPASNPFVGRAGFRPEIWATGLRNPWRFSFDRLTADLFVADVGQLMFEEVNFQPANSPGGENYGWRIMEGFHCFNPNPCNQAGLTLPVVEYAHGSGDCSVTGGYVYRGDTYPRMKGLYFYGDFCSGRIWGLRRDGGGAWQSTLLLDTTIQISAFGEGESGNLFVASYGTGEIYPLADNGPTAPPTTSGTPEVKFGSPSFVIPESAGPSSIPVLRSGDTSVELWVDYATSDMTASSRSDYTAARGTLHFAPGETQKTFLVHLTNDDTREEDETLLVSLSNLVASRGTLEPIPGRTIMIQNDDAATAAENPVDRSDFFVRQHYYDFLNREPDDPGLLFWTQGIETCGADAACREVKRIDTSAAFFLSIEFQETGFLAYRIHKTAFGDLPGRPVPIRFDDFIRDAGEIGAGVVVNSDDWEGRLARNKRSFAEGFVDRAAFRARYPTGQTPAAYVAALNANAGLVLTPAEEADLVARLADGRETRASALLRIAEDEDLRRAETNRAFVLMEYFGYLRRNPDDSPDADFSGYSFWLTKLNQFNGDFRAAEMVKAFISSTEYRRRFGQ